jgi:hypothetical protein
LWTDRQSIATYNRGSSLPKATGEVHFGYLDPKARRIPHNFFEC